MLIFRVRPKGGLIQHNPSGKKHIAKFSTMYVRVFVTHTHIHCADSRRYVTLVELRFHLLSVLDLSVTEVTADSELQYPEDTASLYKVNVISGRRRTTPLPQKNHLLAAVCCDVTSELTQI